MNKSTKQLALLGGGAGLGAGLMYLLDPQGGNQRRTLARDKAKQALNASSTAVRNSATGLGDRGRSLAERSRGLAERSRGLASGAGSFLSADGVKDRVLSELVRTRLGRWVSHPRAIQVDVKEGNVILRGHALTSESADLLLKVSQLKGVKSVESELEVHPSADGVEALQESSSALRRRLPSPKTAGLVAGGALAVAGLLRALRNRQDYR